MHTYTFHSNIWFTFFQIPSWNAAVWVKHYQHLQQLNAARKLWSLQGLNALMKRQMTMPLVSEVGSLGKGTYKGLPGLLRTVNRNSESSELKVPNQSNTSHWHFKWTWAKEQDWWIHHNYNLKVRRRVEFLPVKQIFDICFCTIFSKLGEVHCWLIITCWYILDFLWCFHSWTLGGGLHEPCVLRKAVAFVPGMLNLKPMSWWWYMILYYDIKVIRHQNHIWIMPLHVTISGYFRRIDL